MGGLESGVVVGEPLPAGKRSTVRRLSFLVRLHILVHEVSVLDDVVSCAIARPRFDGQGNEIFDGKIGIFPFVTQEPARRNSINRLAGTLETKPLTSVNRDIMRSYLIEKLLPAIKEKWPRDDMMNPIFIQQDNARTHVDKNDEAFCEAARYGGFDIRLMCQPANSPDLNILDLGFFSAIQSLQYKEAPKTVDELISAVARSYDSFDVRKSNRIFLSLQLCMIEIMQAKGSNKYKIPHINKAKLENLKELPSQLKCDSTLVQEVMQILISKTSVTTKFTCNSWKVHLYGC
ncbi:uncharacterized protein LOC126678579 [Mercurialis annua]|uniref:uncharacterized protein LOC126678579 n=1 Tax=Mercurialis annua TaxID=3986 RepID=UPI00215F080B|nr:uncharacterized protein LOC126678579 [Mercurialis annua]